MSGCRNTLNAMAASCANPKSKNSAAVPGTHCQPSICSAATKPGEWRAREAVTAQDINDNHRTADTCNDVVSAIPQRHQIFTEAANCADVVVMGAPSGTVSRGVLVELSKELRPWCQWCPWSCGLEQHQYADVADHRGGAARSSAASWPPEHAMARATLAAAVLAMPDQHPAPAIVQCFRTRRSCKPITDDVVGVETAGAPHNVFAIMVGMGYSLVVGGKHPRLW